MPWPEWVVPITGSTGTALHGVSPFQPFHRAVASAISASGGYRFRKTTGWAMSAVYLIAGINGLLPRRPFFHWGQPAQTIPYQNPMPVGCDAEGYAPLRSINPSNRT
jgi:hypothetical protein